MSARHYESGARLPTSVVPRGRVDDDAELALGIRWIYTQEAEEKLVLCQGVSKLALRLRDSS